ncbi:MAG: Mur ligase domain-containing protein, partial [Bacillales bacterium]
MRKTVKEIAKWLNVETNGFDDVVVTGVTIDSRMVKEGDLFIPFRGESTNGHRYVEDAFKKGAVCSLGLN